MKKEVFNYLYLLIGSFSLSLGVVGFLSPNKIATGGTAGLAIVFQDITGLSIGILFAIINIPLILIGVKHLGKHFALKTVVAIALMMIFIELLTRIVKLESFSSDPLLATLYGGVLVGIGLGLIFKGGGSAGGGTIIAKIITSKTEFKTGSVILVLDAVVIASAGFVFNSIELALWSLISIFTASKLIDLIITGRAGQKVLHISSYKELSSLGVIIHEQIGVKGTLIKGNNLNGEEQKDVIFIVVNMNRINAIKQIVMSYDKSAKLIVMEATEILG